jgi:hypothetical protein
MFIVQVDRFSPYNEVLSYEFDDFDDAKRFAAHTSNLQGVERVRIFDENDDKCLFIDGEELNTSF